MPASTRSSREATDSLPWITVLAGGIGSRFWPVSTPSRPKQLLPLASDRPLIVDAVERACAVAGDERVRVLTSPALASAFGELLPQLGADAFWAEPEAKGTGPALAWAAWRLHRQDPEAVMISLHADHVIRPLEAFATLLREAVQLARRERLLLTVGAPADRPDPGLGYVQPGEPLDTAPGLASFRVEAFHEKPDVDTAESYVARGYMWNTGLFVWRTGTFLEELEKHAPEIAVHLPRLEDGDVEGFFRAAPPITVDVAILERSRNVGVVRANFQWDDVGSWEAVARTRPSDARGNVVTGEAHLVDSSGNVVFSQGKAIVLFGVEDLVVVETGDVTLVTPRARAADLKDLLSRLPEAVRHAGEGG